jgi:general stress protein YciG
MTDKKKVSKTLTNTELSQKGGKACLKAHGREFYRENARKRWAKNRSAAPSAASSQKAQSTPKASGKIKSASDATKRR